MKPVLRSTATLLVGLLLAGNWAFAQTPTDAIGGVRAAPDTKAAKQSAAAVKKSAKSAPTASATSPAVTQNAIGNSSASATPSAETTKAQPPLPELGNTPSGTLAPYAKGDASAAPPAAAAAEKSKRYPARFRLDDGQYKGFRQGGGDQSASGTSIEPATERARVLSEPRPAPR